jgi:hypothetical protein
LTFPPDGKYLRFEGIRFHFSYITCTQPFLNMSTTKPWQRKGSIVSTLSVQAIVGNPMRPKARGLAQRRRPAWLAGGSVPAGFDFVRDRPTAYAACTDGTHLLVPVWCGSGMFILDQNFFPSRIGIFSIPDPRTASQNFEVF